MISKKTRFQLLLVVSLSLYVMSVFQPWIIEHYEILSDVPPPRWGRAKFWSFQAVWEQFRDIELVNSSVLRYQEYWFAPYYSRFLDPAYIGWLLVFAFQIFTVIAGTLSLVRVQIRDQPFPLIVATIGSILSVAFGVFQWFQQLPPESIIQTNFYLGSVNFTTGFFLAVLSAIHWGISFIYGDFE